MKQPTYHSDDQVTLVEVPFDDETFARLCAFCESIGAPMQQVIFAMVHDVLEDDATSHHGVPDVVRANSNNDLH